MAKIIAVASNNEKGLDSQVSAHFGRCPYYTLVEIEEGEIKKVTSLQNPYYFTHGEPGQVPEFIKKQGAEVVITGGMGPRAIGFFDKLGIKVATGASGNVAEAVDSYLKGNLKDKGPCP
ncbi:NifB/NifX family molybdenum-iron cluster-binding protein [Candidatus Aerophobetes bacterium]|nr:NifB/NifX family molybdenum-iron cluster-binding protein [Candidatus Aerophobetes bacterium]